ncbi:MAG TPA: phosphoribosylglycinamide synthetase C domain-containing protein, partial [Actinomycetota bacterium]|nr:phosphoribosylglycinamide synthetase C domain-containing protein [Actinomycetota bacterium]
SDLGAVCLACARGELSGVKLRWSPQACVSVVLAAPGYPAAPAMGAVISGLEQAARLGDVQVFQAGTAERDGALVTAGGRVLAVSARGHGLEAARARAYEAAGLISFEGVQRRNDIAGCGEGRVAVSETRGE